MKKLLIKIFVLISISNISYAEFYKIDKLKIKLFDSSKLVKTTRTINESFGTAKIVIFAEKTNDNKIKSIITTVKWKGTKFSSDMRTFWTDYFFKSKKGLFYESENNHLNLINENFTNAMVVKEIDFKDYLNQQDEFREFKSTIKKLKKKHDLEIPDRVIKTDHIYIKGGDLIWIGHIFNYDLIIKENYFVDKVTKFNSKIIGNYPLYKNKMDQWTNLSLKRHEEFQNILKIKKKINLNYKNFDSDKSLKYFEDIFYFTDFNLVSNDKDTNKAKKAAEQKAKEEKAKKAAEQKAKEEKAKKAAEQKAKEEKAKKAKTDQSKSQDELSVDDLMSKIKELNEMYKSGLISKDEFELLKSKLLNSN